MVAFLNRVKMTSATTGTGSPLTLGSAVSPFQTVDDAGGQDATVYPYLIEDGNDWEVCTGTYTASGTTITRTTVESSTGSALNLTGNQTIAITQAAAQILDKNLADGKIYLGNGSNVAAAVTPTGDVSITNAGVTAVKRIVQIAVTDPNGSALTTGDGKAYFRVNALLNGYNLTAVAAAITTTSSSGNPTVQINNTTQTADMLSTMITIDSGALDSKDAATPAVIDTGNDDVATGDQLRIDVDVAGTGAKGLIVEMTFMKP